MADKPEPMRIGASGFRAFGAMGAGAPAPDPVPAIDWEALARLPPFQLFLWQRQRGPEDADWHLWARERIPVEAALLGGEQALFDAYCQWHAASGKWLRETPPGKLKE